MDSNPDTVVSRLLDGLPELLTCPQVAAALRISRASAYNLVARGEIPAIHLGGSVRILRADLEKFIVEKRTGGGQ